MRPELALFYLASCLIAVSAGWHGVHKILRHEEWEGDRPLFVAIVEVVMAIGVLIVAFSAVGGA
jgi:hypothetical protein